MTPDPSHRVVRLYRELKRRRVLGSAAGYVVVAALLIELSGAIFDALLFPAWAARLVTVILILGFPVVVVLAWFFDVTAGGVTRTESRPADGARGGDSETLSAAFRRSHAVPVPDAPFRRGARRPAPEPGAEGDASTGPAASPPDPERLRRATLGHVRHELRTPINGIIGYAEMVMEELTEPELVADLERIREAGRGLLALVDGLLQPDRLPPDALDDLPALAAQVEVDLRTPVSAVVGYAEMLMERCEEDGRDHLLPDLERILASAHRLLAASGDIVGIAAAARNGSGAALDASTAMTQEVLAKIRRVTPGAGTAEGVGRLLVVDDNETNRDLIARQLARHGYTVAMAADGREALERLDRQEFELVLLDVIMPVMDGVETLRRIQASPRHRDTPVIMLSSLDETDSAVRCIEMGASDYLSKPVEPTLLEARIAAALEIREMRRREATYRRRIAVDDDLVDRLLRASFPASLLERARAGALDVDVTWPDAAVVRCRLPRPLQPAPGPDAGDRIQRLRELLARLEEVARTHGVDVLVWRPDGFTALLGTGDETEPDVATSAPGPVAGAEAGASSSTGATDGGRPAGGAAERAARLALDTAAVWAGVEARMAIHAGPVVGGVVGRERPRFEVWGDVVETADALAARAPAGAVLVTPPVRGLLEGRFILEPKGVQDVPGSGQMRVHALRGEAGAGEGVGGGAPATSASPPR